MDKSITAWMIKMMQPAFAALNIEFKATNNAVENNPCIPYDLCVKAFAGIDADMVHWEQTYVQRIIYHTIYITSLIFDD